ncbi:MAG: TolC family protein [Oleispira sp.]|nr:TolC family protein [Oleispira sp.]
MIPFYNGFKKPAVRLFAFASIITVLIPVAQAQTSAPAQAGSNMSWLYQQIEALPDIRAAQQQRDASLSQANSYSQALYNPELGASYERESDKISGQNSAQNNYQVSISQKIDWWDQKESREQQAGFLRIQAEQDYRRSYQNTLKNALQAFINWQAAKQRYELALDQEKQLDQLITLVKNRLNSGDLGQIDVELTLLSLSKTFADTAQAVAAYQSSENLVRQWLPSWQPTTPVLSPIFWNNTQQFLLTDNAASGKTDEALLLALPDLRVAKAEWKIQQAKAETVRRSNKAEPTIGITAGKDGSAEIIGLNLSIPLNIRNNYSAINQSALQNSYAAESQYLAKYRQLSYQLDSSRALATQYNKHQQRWKMLMQDSQSNSGELLKRQWKTGDLSTSQYLQALKQRIEGIQAGIVLDEESKLASINWLYNSGQINRIFNF